MKSVNNPWIIQSIIVIICHTFMYLGYKFFVDKMNLPATIVIMYVTLFELSFLILHNIHNNYSFHIKYPILLLIAIVAIIIFIADSLQVKAIAYSPNPGYCCALISCKIITITLASYIAFQSDFTFKKCIGCIITLLGIILISL